MSFNKWFKTFIYILVVIFFGILEVSASEYGSLYITSEPSATIYLNGKDIGQTDKNGEFYKEEISSGGYTVKIIKSGYEDKSLSVEIYADLTTSKDIPLKLKEVKIEKPPEPTEPQPPSKPKPAPEKEVSKKPSIPPTPTERPKPPKVTPSPLPSYGSINCTSIPPGANIYLKKGYQGTTSKIISHFLPGEYKIRLTKSGYEDYYGTVSVYANKTVSFDAELSPIILQRKFPGLVYLIIAGIFGIGVIVGSIVIKRPKSRAIMFADMEGYTAYTEREGTEKAAEMIRVFLNKILLPIIKRCKGRLKKRMGDGFMVIFDDSANAVLSAVEIQKSISAYNKDKILAIRIGINYGEILFGKGDMLSRAINIASRVSSLAKGGDILITETLYNLAKERVKERTKVQFEPLGLRDLKGVGKVSIYKVIYEPKESMAEIPKERFLRWNREDEILNQQIQQIGEERLTELLKRLFPDCKEVTLPSSHHGFSGAFVIRTNPINQEGTPVIPCIVKLNTPAENIHKEKGNFDKHVRKILTAHPDLYTDRVPEVDNWAGIVYSKIGGSWDEIITFEEFYKKDEQLEKITEVLEKLLKKIMFPWYTKIDHTDMLLYQDVYNIREKRLEKIKAVRDSFHSNEKALDINPDPIIFWEENKKKEGFFRTITSIVHGDLNSRNIIINSRNNDIYLIDFEHTGKNHFLVDFIKLEAEIKFRLMNSNQENNFKRIPIWCELEKQLLAEDFGANLQLNTFDKEIKKEAEIISYLRSLAKGRMVNHESMKSAIKEYYIGLLYRTLSVLTYQDVSEAKKRYAYQSAAMICQYLQGSY